jgi:hypothetical protein
MSYGMQGNKIPKGYSQGRIQQFDPQQMELYKQLFGHLGPESYTARLAGGDQKLFEEMEAPALRQFSGQLGGLASRFSQGGLGARKSTGFQNASTAAASNFAQDLQSQRQGLQRQALQDLMGFSNQLLGQRPQENFLVPKNKPWWQELLLGIGQTAVKSGVESSFKGPPGYGG